MQEPSVLDYLKDRLAFWRPARLHLPAVDGSLVETPSAKAAEVNGKAEALAASSKLEEVETRRISLPWRVITGFGLALLAQLALEPPARALFIGVPLYIVATGMMIWGILKHEWRLTDAPKELRIEQPDIVGLPALGAAVVLTLVSYWLFGGGRFTLANLFTWLFAIYFYLKAFWIPKSSQLLTAQMVLRRLRRANWGLRVTPLLIIWTAAILLIIYLRTTQLNQVPAEMVSDHAEKLLDVLDVTKGASPIYFVRNTGREAFQFYWTVLMAGIFKTGVSFMSLKIGTVLAGLLTLPYMYLLGREVGNKWIGFYAVVFCGIAYWPNVFSRLGLRFPLYPLFTAPALYYLIHGLRTSNRNDFILSGLALGIGLHGYTSIRILPFLIVIAIGLFLVHAQSRGFRQQAVLGIILVALFALIAFLPLLRYAIDNPDMFAYRAFSRMGSVERPLPGPAWLIFLSNLWNALTMFFWSDGQIWVHSVQYRPALDFISAALFAAGLVLLAVRYLRRRHWVDIFLLISVPVLMLPSILSLAFPDENPSLNRTSGAIVPVFLIVALGMDALITGLNARLNISGRKWIPGLAAALLILVSAGQNYDLVFNQYAPVYRQNTWNTSEMGEIIKGFSSSIGSRDAAWVVGYPYWVDTRLVGFTSGYPGHDYAIWPDQIPATLDMNGPKLFILNLQDETAVSTLQATYPSGLLWRYTSRQPGKDFLMFLALPSQTPILNQPEGSLNQAQ